MEEEAAYKLFTLNGAKHSKLEPNMVILQVNNVELDMEVDTGSAITSMPPTARPKHLPPLPQTNK